MKVAVMQPYLFPYLGYYQLVNSVDKFVFYDNVNFIKGGYINRNIILANEQPLRFTWPVEKQSSFSRINELNFVTNTRKILKTIEQNYIKAPYFSDVFPLIKNCFQHDSLNVASITAHSVSVVFNYLGIKKEFMFASQLSYDFDMSAEEKLFAICKLLEADVYINAKGGKELYSKSAFLSKHIQLNFIESGREVYDQGMDKFVPNLSIIDVLMWNSKSRVIKLLSDYRLV